MVNVKINNKFSEFSLYIHFPWCIKKCFYCDFNSYAINKKYNNFEENYLKKIFIDFDYSLKFLHEYKKTNLISIFFGGGTPSLLSSKSINKILNYISKKIVFNKNIEISLEVNPGSIEHANVFEYKDAGITRLSLGVQSFQDHKLKLLGRVHKSSDVHNVLKKIQQANFNSFNIDLMYGLPEQSVTDSLYDLKSALSYNPLHLSWYQLTLEPNTLFFNKPPTNLPQEDIIWEMYQQGIESLEKENYINYEISAFAKEGNYCLHNLNYWQYGDYLGIGPGSHSKLSMFEDVFRTQNLISSIPENVGFAKNISMSEDLPEVYQKIKILRFDKVKNPKNYLNCEADKLIVNYNSVSRSEAIFEFMLNNLRLEKGFSEKDFYNKTKCNFKDIKKPLDIAVEKKLLVVDNNNNFVRPTALGRRFLNDFQSLFLFVES